MGPPYTVLGLGCLSFSRCLGTRALRGFRVVPALRGNDGLLGITDW